MKLKRNIKLSQRERNALYNAYSIISGLYDRLNEYTGEEEVLDLMCEEDTELIGELRDLTTDTLEKNSSLLWGNGYYDE